jgi:hypothetical protein
LEVSICWDDEARFPDYNFEEIFLLFLLFFRFWFWLWLDIISWQ